MKTIALAIIIIFNTNYFINAQEFTFNYNPGENLTYKLNLSTQKRTTIDGIEKKYDEIIIKSLTKITKNKSGYFISKTPLSMNSKRNGEQFVNPLFTFLTSIPIRYNIDKNGNLVDVSGYEGIIEKAKKQLSKEAAESMILVANEEAMINKTKAEWNARISNFAGQTVQIGDMFSGEGKFPLPNGETVTFFSVIKITDSVEFEDNKCLRIRFMNNTDPKALADFMDVESEEINHIFNVNINDDVSTEIQISGEGERIIDPTTMLIYYENNTRKIDMKSDVIGDENRTITTIEINEYDYEY